MKIFDFTNLFEKYLNRIKNISLILLIVMFFVSLIVNGCNKKRSEELFERVTKLRFQNEILKKQVIEVNLAIQERQRIQDSLQLAYNLKVTELNILRGNYVKLRIEFIGLKDSILKIPAEESYEFLNKIAYPYPGDKRFPFNEPQIKGIHLTWIENSNLKLQNKNLVDQVNQSELIISDLKNINKQIEEKFKLSMSNCNKYKDMFENSEKVRIYTDNELKRMRRQNKVLRWGVIGGAGSGFLFGLLLLR